MNSVRPPIFGIAALLSLGFCAVLVNGCTTQNGEHVREAEKPQLDCGLPGTNAAREYLPHGCANRANLQAMLADPEDLTRTQILTPASGSRETRAVETYLLGKANPNSSSGQTSIIDPAATPATPRGN